MPSPYAWLIIFTSSPYGWFPAIGYNNPAFDSLVFEAWGQEATDADAAGATWAEAQRILHDEAVSIFAMDAPLIIAHGNDIEGLVPVPPYSAIVFWYEMKRQP